MCNYIIYKHINTTNGKVYIGMTNNPKRRWRSNGIEYKSYTNNNLPFWNAIEKYGWNSFKTVVLKKQLTYEDACELEKYYIEKYKATDNRYGYNIAEGGNGGRIYKEHPRGMLGKTHTIETRERIREFMFNNNPMYKGFWDDNGGHPRGMLNKNHTEKTKSQISETLIKKDINCKPVDLVYPNGEIKHFKSQTECAKYMDTTSTSSMFLRLIKTGEPLEIKYKNQYTKKLIPFIGVRLIDKTKENIEVN